MQLWICSRLSLWSATSSVQQRVGWEELNPPFWVQHLCFCHLISAQDVGDFPITSVWIQNIDKSLDVGQSQSFLGSGCWMLHYGTELGPLLGPSPGGKDGRQTAEVQRVVAIKYKEQPSVKQEIESHPGGAGRQASRLEMLAGSAESQWPESHSPLS